MSTEKKYIYSLVISWTALLALMLLAVQTGFAQTGADAYQTESFKVSGAVSLEVQTSGGSIEVAGSNENEVLVEMYVRRRGKYVKAGEADLDDYEISITQNGNTVKAVAERRSNGRWNWNNGYSISFKVYTPRETRSRLKTSGGSLTAKNLKGSQELRTSGGSITTEAIQGQMMLRTSGGSISIKDVQGDAEARTSGGTIRADVMVGNLNANTSGGSIRLAGIEGNVEAKTSGGSIHAEIIAPDEIIDLRTSGGSIRITVPDSQGYDLDLDANRVHAELINFNGRAERDEIRGTFNGGGTLLKAKTSGGSIRLDYL